MYWMALLFALFLFQDPPPPVVIQDATVVIAPGTEIRNATVVIRNGLIHSVGTEGESPKDARIIDGNGLVVYAGFMDSFTTLGLDEQGSKEKVTTRSEGRTPDFTRQPLFGMQDSNRKGLHPEIYSATLLQPSKEKLKSWRQAGYTAALTGMEKGYLSGRSSLFSLSGAPLRESFLISAGPMIGSFSSSGEGYPGTLMGMFAHLRQLFLDARAYGEQWRAYRAAPRGKRRPPVDPALEAMQGVLERKVPVVFQADSENEILRALRLSEELGFRLMIAGGSSAYRVVDRLKGIPVLLRLDLPDEPGEDKNKPKRLVEEEKREWKERIGCAASLEASGIPFAFSSSGTSPGDTLKTIQKLNLTHNAALRALTVTPAKIFGLTEMGKVRPGMMAHLTLLSGRLGSKKARVRYVISDGWLLEVPAKAKGKGKPAVNVTGTWKASTGSFEWTMVLKQDGSDVTGTVDSRYGKMKVTGSVDGSTFLISGSMEGAEITIDGKIKDGRMSGTMTSPYGENAFKARKPEDHRE